MAGVVDLDGKKRSRKRRPQRKKSRGMEWQSKLFGGEGAEAGTRAGASGGGGTRRPGVGKGKKLWHFEPPAERKARQVYVGDLNELVTDDDLRVAFSSHVKVVHAFVVRDEKTKRSRGFGYVRTTTPHAVQKLLQLNKGEVQIHGEPVSIKTSRQRNILPGEQGYVRRPISDREFELDPVDPTQPNIHMLVDDVLFKIFEYLPLRTLIGVERVCRRWQMIVQKTFAKQTKLNLGNDLYHDFEVLTRPILNKVLILAGPTLKELKLRNVDDAIGNSLSIVSQLCPALESFDIRGITSADSSHVKALTKGCKNLKSFSIEECDGFNSKELIVLLSNCVQLEKLSIPGLPIEGNEFNLLPFTLKELKITWTYVKPENLKIIGDRCPNLELLIMDYTKVDREVLEHIGTHCTKLLELKLSVRSQSCAEALQTFKKLKRLDLTLELDFEISGALEHMSDLEQLCLRGNINRTQSCNLNFKSFKKLESLAISSVPMSANSLRSIAKCINLKTLQVRSCSMTSSILLDILRGCPRLEKSWTPDIETSKSLLNTINEIMKPRVGPLSLGLLSDASFEEADYDIDHNKIKFSMAACFRFQLDFDNESNQDSDDFLYSDEDYFDDESWIYDSDSSLPDAEMLAGVDFLDYHLGLFNFSLDSEDDLMGLAAF